MSTVTRGALLDRIERLGGLTNHEEAAAALRATLCALGERLSNGERKQVAAALPPRERALLTARRFRGAFDMAEFFERARRREKVSLGEKVSIGFAREHAQVVCRVLGEVLPKEAMHVLDDALPESFAELFHPQEPRIDLDVVPEARFAPRDRDHTLASGKPGSRHPLCESAPRDAHSHSVAREANPHADTKISSATGTTQERLNESLATNQPDPSRTISRSRP